MMPGSVKENKRIGVFLCRCGSEIADQLDLTRVKEEVEKLPAVASVVVALYHCSRRGLAQLKETIKKQKLDGVIVAGCTPRTHEALFRTACGEVGLNRYLLEMVNLREQCARVHQGQNERATSKAIALIRMGVAKLSGSRSREPLRTEIEPSALVIGGGIAGMTAALALANRGVKVRLVEKEASLGGMLRGIGRLHPSGIAADGLIAEKVAEVTNNPNIEVSLDSHLTGVLGHVGRYQVTTESPKGSGSFTSGVIIVATGARVFVPHKMYRYRLQRGIVTQLEFEDMMRRGEVTARNVVMIQCVGARDKERPYCARLCCPTAIKNAIALKQRFLRTRVTILHRGFPEFVEGLDEARDMGISFMECEPDKPPQVRRNAVKLWDESIEMEAEIPFDLLILATPLVPHLEAEELADMLRIPRDENGFMVESHVKLRPDQFLPNGIFIAGCAHWPATVGESITQAYGAAARAYALIESGQLEREPTVAVLEEAFCRGCGSCEEVCEYSAVRLEEGDDGLKVSKLDQFLCTGCGSCVSVCPSGALKLGFLTDKQMHAVLGEVGR
jgi:heterodisulfide reductase subunit A